MCRKKTAPDMLPYMNMTRETALWMASEERLNNYRQKLEKRRRSSERWNLK